MSDKFRKGDKVWSGLFGEFGIANGTRGVVERVSSDGSIVYVLFEGRKATVSCEPSQISRRS